MNFIKHILINFGLIVALTACGGNTGGIESFGTETGTVEPSQEMTTLAINASAVTSYAPIFIAEAEGYFEDVGIQLEYITLNRSIDAVAPLLTGDIDIYASSFNAGILNVLGQEDGVKVVADRGHISPDDECAYIGLLFNKELYASGALTEPADLAGRNVASSTTAVTGYILSEYLAQAGLSLDDVTIVDLPSASLVDSMENGTVDVISNVEPRLTQLVDAGNAVLAVEGSDVVGNLQTSLLVFGGTLLGENREVGVRFLTAYLRAVQQYNQGKTDRNVEILAEYTGESEEALRTACWASISSDGWIDFDSAVTGFQQWNIDQGLLDQAITEDQFWDPSLLEDAWERLDLE
jgi:NitT/TauT family transport system substrate-binding protein